MSALEIELRLYDHPHTRARAYGQDDFPREDMEVDAYGWEYSEGDRVGSYVLTDVGSSIYTDDARGNYIIAAARLA